VALARAIASGAEILLLDEPFGSLDYRTARYMRLEVRRLQKRLNWTILFVTHNFDEARELGDRIGIMRKGCLRRVGSPDLLWIHENRNGKGELDPPNVLACTGRKELGNGLVEMMWAGIRLLVPDEGEPFDRVLVHPAHVYISRLQPPGPPINRFQASISQIDRRERDVYVTVLVNGASLLSKMDGETFETLHVSTGDSVYGILKLRALHGVSHES
jgi:ABC-type sulfate/molybdate transport systems ATPase subunit